MQANEAIFTYFRPCKTLHHRRPTTCGRGILHILTSAKSGAFLELGVEQLASRIYNSSNKTRIILQKPCISNSAKSFPRRSRALCVRYYQQRLQDRPSKGCHQYTRYPSSDARLIYRVLGCTKIFLYKEVAPTRPVPNTPLWEHLRRLCATSPRVCCSSMGSYEAPSRCKLYLKTLFKNYAR